MTQTVAAEAVFPLIRCLRSSLLAVVLMSAPALWGCGDSATPNNSTSVPAEEDGGGVSSDGSFWGGQDGAVDEDTEGGAQDTAGARPDLPVIGGSDTGDGEDEEELACGLEDQLAPNQSAETAYAAGTDFRQEELYICPATSAPSPAR